MNTDISLVPISEVTTEDLKANSGLNMLCNAFKEGKYNYNKRKEKEKKLKDKILRLEQENRQLMKQLNK